MKSGDVAVAGKKRERSVVIGNTPRAMIPVVSRLKKKSATIAVRTIRLKKRLKVIMNSVFSGYTILYHGGKRLSSKKANFFYLFLSIAVFTVSQIIHSGKITRRKRARRKVIKEPRFKWLLFQGILYCITARMVCQVKKKTFAVKKCPFLNLFFVFSTMSVFSGL